MPPRRRVSAPVNRVYESGPTLHQTKFKSPPKTTKKKGITYGRKTIVRIPKPKVDNTLTQMDYVKMNEPPDFGPENEDLDGQSDYEQLAEKRKKKRRKTTGDEPSTTPQYHQSTMTQFARSFSSAYEEEEEVPDMYDLPSSSQPPALPKRSSKRTAGKENAPPPAKSPARVIEKLKRENTVLAEIAPPRNSMPPPQTPRKTIAREIPSSQSPATPLSTRSLRSLTNRNPLQERRINPPAFGNSKQISNSERATVGNDQTGVPLFTSIRRTTHASPEKLPKLEIGDTFDTATDISQMTRIPSSSIQGRSSPAKSVRFAIPDQVEEIEEPLSPVVKKEVTPVPALTSLGSGKVQVEIQDSDAEDDEFDFQEFEERSRSLQHTEEKDGMLHIEEPEISGNGDKDLDSHVSEDQPRLLDHGEEAEFEAQKPDISGENNDDSISESNYGEIGEETQFQANRVVDRLTSSPNAPSLTKETQPETSIESVTEAAQVTDTQALATEAMFEKTQMMETQRITSSHLQAMAPRTANSDVFVSMPPQTLTSILSRARTHETRNWALPPGVVRLWIYETKPVCALKYMCSVGPVLRPGQITDETGLGNKEFNKKSERGNWRAYEIMAVYELLDPIELAVLLQREWFRQPPRTFSRVGPAVADELVGNLKPPLFDKTVEEEQESNPNTPLSSQTDTQEAEAQLLNTIKQYTQPAEVLFDVAVSQFFKPEPKTQLEFSPTIPSSQDEAAPEQENEEPRLPPPLSQATTVDLWQTQTPRRRHHHRSYHQKQSPSLSFQEDDDEIVLESPVRQVPSSTPARIDSTPIQLPKLRNYRSTRSGAETEMQPPESMVPHSMASSQLLTRSQLLSESLLQDSVPGPPPFIGDSENEDDEEL